MVAVTLPDGSKREFAAPVTIAEVAQSIGSGLAKAALAGSVDGRLVDLSYTIDHDVQLAIITDKNPEGLDIIRHSTAHLLAYAVKELFPDAQVTIGPVIENGFYYDFSYHRPFTPDDLAALEKKMLELAKKDEPVSRQVMPRDQAVEFFKQQGELYKAEIIASIPQNEEVSLYTEGKFTDLCRGPHVPSTGKLKVFKLMKLAGAYWRGDSKNEMLQRIYGTAWTKKEDQDAYLHMLEEAEKRDHRRLGKQLDLFHFQDEAPGLVFWHPKGWAIWQEVEQYMRRVYQNEGYQEVKAPQILDRGLWEKSGHWDNYKENMFTTESENRAYALKPMNCPGHVQIFNSGLHSYRELPLRFGEFGQCHRNEPSGALHGLMRVRGFTQDDGHIFCTEDQIQAEVAAFDQAVRAVYRDFGFTEVAVKLALRPAKRVGDDAIWDKAEASLRGALKASGQTWEELPGEGAFYGPKIDIHIQDALDRSWQCGTVQLDMALPEKFELEYTDHDGKIKRPVMIHRAIFGSIERFLGILIEHFAGRFPLWISPRQVRILPIADRHHEYAKKLHDELKHRGIQVETDFAAESLNKKIRQAQLDQV
ncbi:MAG: threonine--tRNA ligase, partial [Burkholderiaceae bacterium]|nr:threonine--tRNA ligase [Burkholderiaceae bacterium]